MMYDLLEKSSSSFYLNIYSYILEAIEKLELFDPFDANGFNMCVLVCFLNMAILLLYFLYLACRSKLFSSPPDLVFGSGPSGPRRGGDRRERLRRRRERLRKKVQERKGIIGVILSLLMIIAIWFKPKSR